jgi:hypothetical protein
LFIFAITAVCTPVGHTHYKREIEREAGESFSLLPARNAPFDVGQVKSVLTSRLPENLPWSSLYLLATPKAAYCVMHQDPLSLGKVEKKGHGGEINIFAPRVKSGAFGRAPPKALKGFR